MMNPFVKPYYTTSGLAMWWRRDKGGRIVMITKGRWTMLKGRKKKCRKCGRTFKTTFTTMNYKTCQTCYVEQHKGDTIKGGLRTFTHIHKGPRKEFVWKRREA
jgi:hypothetical protein